MRQPAALLPQGVLLHARRSVGASWRVVRRVAPRCLLRERVQSARAARTGAGVSARRRATQRCGGIVPGLARRAPRSISMTPQVRVERLVANARRLRCIEGGESVRLGLQVYRSTAPWVSSGPAPPPVVFVRGLGMTMTDSHHFASLLALSPSRRGSAVVTFDHLGFGESSVPEPHWGEGSIRGMALDALDVADCASAALGSPSFDLFGVSMGGYIAMSAALERQRQFKRGALIESEHGANRELHGSNASAPRVRALVVGCSHHGGPSMEPITSPYVARLRELEQHEPRSEGWRRAVRELYALNFSPAFVHSSPRFAGLLGAFEESCLCDTRAGLAYQNTAVERFYREGMREELAELRLASLIITGDQDSIVPSTNSLLLKQCLPGARLEMLRGAGHMFFEEAPERTVDIVAGWLLRDAPAPASASAPAPALAIKS